MKRSHKGPITARELDILLHSDPEWVEAKRIRDEKMAARKRYLDEAQKDLVAELNVAGFPVKSVWDLVNSPNYYDDAIPILLRHLMIETYPEVIRDGIIRALAIPAAREHWPLFARLYRSLPRTSAHNMFEDGLAVALSATVSDSTFDELIEMINDESLGESRLLLLWALRRSKKELAKQTIEKLANHPVFKTEIGSWRKRKKKPSAPS
jgi:hypothetical protein